MIKEPKIIVYLGPTLPVEKAKRILPSADYRPPAKQSDILSAVENDDPDAIVLIDGCFHHNRSPWHKEILYALSKGVHVFGAASMGAIRAAECDVFGMKGIGDAYKRMNGMASCDDLVAVSQDEDGEAISLPLINVEATLQRMLEETDIHVDRINATLKAFKETYFSERVIALVPKDIRADFSLNYQDVKKNDALECLKLVARSYEEISEPFVAHFRFHGSHLFDAQFDRDRKYKTESGEEIPLSMIDSWAAINSPTYERDNFDAANREAALILCKMLGIQLQPHEVSIAESADKVKRENLYIRQLHRAIRTSRAMRRNTEIYLSHAQSHGGVDFMDDLAESAIVQEKCIKRIAPDIMDRPIPGDDVLNDLAAPRGLEEFMSESGISTIQELKVEAERRNIMNGAIG